MGQIALTINVTDSAGATVQVKKVGEILRISLPGERSYCLMSWRSTLLRNCAHSTTGRTAAPF